MVTSAPYSSSSRRYAFEMAAQLQKRIELFDLSKLPQRDQDRYGSHDLGRHLLLARRLLLAHLPAEHAPILRRFIARDSLELVRAHADRVADALVDAVRVRYSRIDVLINCAASPSGLVRNQIEDLDAAALLQDLDTKVVGYARCCKADGCSSAGADSPSARDRSHCPSMGSTTLFVTSVPTPVISNVEKTMK